MRSMIDVIITIGDDSKYDDVDDDDYNDDDHKNNMVYLSKNRFEQRIMLITHDKIINSFLDSRSEEWSTNK